MPLPSLPRAARRTTHTWHYARHVWSGGDPARLERTSGWRPATPCRGGVGGGWCKSGAQDGGQAEAEATEADKKEKGKGEP